MTTAFLQPQTSDLLDLRLLLDVGRLQELQDEFVAETGMAVITVDSLGIPVTGPSGFTPLCQFLRRDPTFRQRCQACDANGGIQAALKGATLVYRCHSGAVDFSVPIFYQGENGPQYVGALLAGQVRLGNSEQQLGQITQLTNFDSDKQATAADLLAQLPIVTMAALERAAGRLIEAASSAAFNQKQLIVGPTLRSGLQSGDELPLTSKPAAKPAQEPDAASRDFSHLDQLPITPLQLAGLATKHVVSVEQAQEPEFGDPALNPQPWLDNLQDANLGANLEIASDYLDRLMPRWIQKVTPAQLQPLEDLLTQIASDHYKSALSRLVELIGTQHSTRRDYLNRYAAQLYVEKLVITLHEARTPTPGQRDRSIESLIQEIHKDPTSFLTVAQAADYLSCSESHFARRFRDTVGISFNQFVTFKRMERAKFLLAQTDQPIARIANSLKFQPLNYFSRAFKREFGITPSDYRAEVAAQNGCAK